MRTHQTALALMARYSEDMQDGIQITMTTLSAKTTLTVRNPFAAGFVVPA